MQKIRCGMAFGLLFVVLLWSPIVQGQDAAFDLNNIATAVVQINNEASGVLKTGVFVTPTGMIITANVEESFLVDEPVEIFTFTSIDQQPELAFQGTVIATADVFAVIQISHDEAGNELDLDNLNLAHYNPIERTVTIELLETVYAVSYPEVGDGYLTTTRGAINGFNKISNDVSPDLLADLLFYQSDVTMDVQGLGGPVVTFSGDFVGIAVELPLVSRQATTDDVLAQIAPVTTLCIVLRDICTQIMEGYRPTPEDRLSRPTGLFWLEGGVGLTTGEALPRGEIEVEYYCSMFGLRARTNADESEWECFSPRDDAAQYWLTIFDYDIICQQSYRNPMAIAIQDGNRFAAPVYRWRCYG